MKKLLNAVKRLFRPAYRVVTVEIWPEGNGYSYSTEEYELVGTLPTPRACIESAVSGYEGELVRVKLRVLAAKPLLA